LIQGDLAASTIVYNEVAFLRLYIGLFFIKGFKLLLKCHRSKDFARALELYNQLLTNHDDDAEGGYDCVLSRIAPAHEILAHQAEIYLEGGCGIERNPSKAGEGVCVPNVGLKPDLSQTGCIVCSMWATRVCKIGHVRAMFTKSG